MKPIVALVGRPNVGKSTLFNRIIGKRKAITFDIPGVTRDRHYATAFWEGREFLCVDTGGFPAGKGDSVETKIEEQILLAIEEASVVLFIVDAQTGLTPFDRTIAERLRRSRKNFLIVVNKIDVPSHEEKIAEFYGLGRDLYPVSAEHGARIGDLLDVVVKNLPTASRGASSGSGDEKADIKIALIGRPNVGKSSLLNRLTGFPRAVVDELPGTTRDVIDSLVTLHGKKYLLLDTAGIRKKGKSDSFLERTCIILAEKAIRRADLCLLVLDAGAGLSRQEASIAGFAAENGRGIIVLVNKWDLSIRERGNKEPYVEKIRTAFKFVPFSPVLFVSAKSGFGIPKIWEEIDGLYGELGRNWEKETLGEILFQALEKHPPPLYRGYPPIYLGARQVGQYPPTLIVYLNHPEAVHFSMERYLLSQFRKGLGLERGPLRILFRKGN
ncbi:MAG: ribosome biogenesis GTPase Der [Deltaproteobacteria bacterium]|nr:ribosome biogenesis GTPase Der [Deltaproteobacteria bacterium]